MLIYFVLVPILTGAFLYLFPFAKAGRVVAIFAQAALLAAAVYLFSLVQTDEMITGAGNYTGVLGVFLRADRLAAVFVMLTALVFLLVAVYSFHEENRLFWFLLFIFEGALIGLFLTRDLFNLFVLAEVSTVVAAILLMYQRNRRSMYHGMAYLLVNVIVMQFYLLGIGFIYRMTGVLDMEYSAYLLSTVDRSELVLPFALTMTAIAAKASLLPLFTFLPKVHSITGAPAAVAAILSGLQVKSGLYLFLRFRPLFASLDLDGFFLILGAITALFGVIFALVQSDIKRILAYSTIAQVGLIMIGLNLPDAYAYYGSVYHIVGHAIVKSALFFGAGIVANTYGTQNIAEIRGVFRRMPAVGIATVLAILGITGAPLFSGNISKYFMMAEVNLPLFILMSVINLGTILVFIKYAAMLFGQPRSDLEPVQTEKIQQFVILLLGGFSFIGGVLGESFIFVLFGVDLSVSFGGYVQKIIILVVSWGLGYLLYTYFPRNDVWKSRIRRLDFGFRGICVSIGVFFAIALLVVGFLI